MSQEQKIDQILRCVETMQQDVSSIKRAVYGDPINQVPGLIERQNKDEAAIQSLKEGRKKLGWVLAGFIAAIQAVYFLFKEIISK